MLRLVVAVLSLILCGQLDAQCVGSKQSPGSIVNYPSIYINLSGVPSQYHASITKGASKWNRTGNCPGGGFPPVSLTPGGTQRVMYFSFQPGYQPNGSGEACAVIMGNSIVLYEFARSATLEVIPCMRSDVLENTASHEMGHAYQLNDSGCGAYIMGQIHYSGGSYTPRTIRADECSMVDSTYMTQSEIDEAAGTPDGDDPEAPPGPGVGGTPILLDLDRGGFRLTDLAGGVGFDLDRDGVAEAISWTEAGHGDAWLALDRNGNGTIDDGGELFGNFTDQPSTSEPNGYRALAVFDEDDDGRLSAADTVFGQLQLWTDANQDGISQPVELRNLRDSGVLWLALAPVESRRRDPHGNEFRYKALVRLVGGMTQSVDVFLLSGP